MGDSYGHFINKKIGGTNGKFIPGNYLIFGNDFTSDIT